MELAQALTPESLAIGTVALAVVVLAFVYLMRISIGFLSNVLLPLMNQVNVIRAEWAKEQRELYEAFEGKHKQNNTAIVVRMDEHSRTLQIIEKGVNDIDDILAAHNVEAANRHTESTKRLDYLESAAKNSTNVGDEMLGVIRLLPDELTKTQNLIREAEERMTEAQDKNTQKVIDTLDLIRTTIGNTIKNLTGVHNALAAAEDKLKEDITERTTS